MPLGSVVVEFWHDQLVAHDSQALFIALVAFLAAFTFIRLSARLIRSPRAPWWPGSVVTGGVHIHHLVYGIFLMMGSGIAVFAVNGDSPGLEICAATFGIGAGLTLDEFALWVYLDDVYWAEEGRKSIDAAVVAATIMALVLFGARPFEIGTHSAGAVLGSVATAALVIVLVGVCFLKDRVLHGIVGFFLWPVALFAALRLAKPDSFWARRRYGRRNPAKQARAEARFTPERRTERAKNWFRDKVGGSVGPGQGPG